MLWVTKRLRIESGLENGSCGTHFNILFSQRTFIYFLTYFLKDSEFCCSNKKKKRLFMLKKLFQQENSHIKNIKMQISELFLPHLLSSRLSWQSWQEIGEGSAVLSVENL